MSSPTRLTAAALLALAIGVGTETVLPQSATASPICTAAGWVSGIAGKACDALSGGSKVISAGKKLLSGHIGDAAKTLVGGGSGAAGRALGLAAIGAWVVGGANAALHAAIAYLGHTTEPQLRTSWFSATYWRVAGVAAVLTLPFLFAASLQALMRSDLALLLRTSLGYLPLALLAVSIAAPVTMLLLAASDQLSSVVAGATGEHALNKTWLATGITAVGSPFLGFLLGLFLVIAAVTVWLELVIREAAVYVVVLMLPLTFAALVWPARRVWAVRTVELLLALILSKFAIVAVLSLAAAAVGHSVSGMIVVVALFTMAAFAPWALVRLFPLAELASGAATSIRGELAGKPYAVVESRRGAERATRAIEDALDMPEDGLEPTPAHADREAARAERDGMQERKPMPVAAREVNGATVDSEPVGTGDAGGPESDTNLPAPGADLQASSSEIAPDNEATDGAQTSADEMRSRLAASLRTAVILGPEGVPNNPPPGPNPDVDPLPPHQESEDGLL